ncbi:MAG: CopG family transcriptional regulator [Acidimicrobiales bacterium]
MRTQIALDDEVHARVRQKAADLGVTMAEYIRQLVHRDLDGPEPATDPSVIFALGGSGGSDIASDRSAAQDAFADIWNRN